MTMCKITQFKIDNTDVGTRPVGANEDSLACYTVSSFTLEKKLFQPNEFRFTLRRDQVGRQRETIQFNLATGLLSKTVQCKVTTALKGNVNDVIPGDGLYNVEFEGIIVSAAMENVNISCVALSKDCNLTLIPHCNYFIDKTLKEIVESIWTDANHRVVNPHYTEKIPYIVQYNETDYQFLVRLAKRYGEFFYYDKESGLVFGKIPDANPVDLKQFDDFFHVTYELGTNDPNFGYVAYHYPSQGLIHSDLQNYRPGSNLYDYSRASSAPLAANINLYYDYPNPLPYNANAAFLNLPENLWIENQAANFVVCKCTTYRLDLHVGSKIRFIEDVGTDHYNNGYLIVTSACMSWDCNGSPVNQITAMAFPDGNIDDIIPPYIDVNAYPRSSSQRAFVVDNVDPLKMGRVMVRFAWQDVGQADYAAPNNDDEKRKQYPWIRIAQPYGGDKKGCYILPEIGEEVMVGFEHGNMEKPFVIGTLFHDSSSEDKKQMPDESWVEQADSNVGNEVKAFRTKKGHTIEFHDTQDGDGFIRIYGNEKKDQPNYNIILSTDKIQKANGDNKEDYTVKCPDDAAQAGQDIKEKEGDYKAEKLRILVQSNGGDIMLDAGDGDIIMNAKNIRVHTTGDRTTLIDGKDILKVKGEQLIDVDSESLMIQKDQNIQVKGKDTEKYTQEVSIEASKAYELKAQNLSTDTTKDTSMKVTGQFEINATGNAKVSSQSGLDLNSNSKAELKGTDVTIDAKIGATLKGVEINVKADGVNTVKGTSLILDAVTGTRKGQWTDM